MDGSGHANGNTSNNNMIVAVTEQHVSSTNHHHRLQHHHHHHHQQHELPEFMRQDSLPDSSRDDEYVTDTSASQRNGKESNADEFERTINGLGMKKAVKYSRIAVLVILLVSAVGLAAFIYMYTNNSELDQFEKQFEEDSRKVLGHVGTELDFTMGAADAFIVEEIASAQQTNQSWPYVTNPGFAVRAAKLRSLTKALVVITYPYVTDSNRQEWETYSLQNDGWVEKGLRVQQNDANFQGTTVTSWSKWGRIHGNEGLHLGPGPYFPTWNSYPIVPLYAAYNWDIRLVSTEINRLP